MTVTKTKKKRTGASSTAAANGPSGAVAAEIPVPPSDAGHVEESGNGGDPWVEHDPWAQPSNPDQWKPSLDGYLQFCTWWNTAMASESNETSFSTGDSGGRGGKGYGGGVSAEGKGKGKGGRHHRHRDSSDPGQQQHGRQPGGGSHGGGHQRPFLRILAAVLPDVDLVMMEMTQRMEKTVFPSLLVRVQREEVHLAVQKIHIGLTPMEARPEQVR